MAILEKETNNYYKIDFDNCSIRGTKVYVNFSSYLAKEDRDREKERKDAISIFKDKLRAECDSLYSELLHGVNALGVSYDDILSVDDKIDSNKYPSLALLQENVNSLICVEGEIDSYLYIYGNAQAKERSCILDNPQLALLGLKEDWITQPIRITSGAEVYVGEYNNEDISHEFYYTRLKTVMNENIEDC